MLEKKNRRRLGSQQDGQETEEWTEDRRLAGGRALALRVPRAETWFTVYHLYQ